MKHKLNPGLSSSDWKEFCGRFHFSADEMPGIRAIYTALFPLIEACAYYSLDQDLDEVGLAHYAYGFVTLGNGTDKLAELYLDTKIHADLRQLCNTCENCRNFSCPSRKSPARSLPHTYGAMQIFHIK